MRFHQPPALGTGQYRFGIGRQGAHRNLQGSRTSLSRVVRHGVRENPDQEIKDSARPRTSLASPGVELLLDPAVEEVFVEHPSAGDDC
jgi:hypothetical protein